MALSAVFFDLYQTLAYFHPPREQRLAAALREFGFQVEESALYGAYLAADQFYTRANLETPAHLKTEEQKDRMFTRYQEVILEETGIAGAFPLAAQIYKRYWQMEREFHLFPDVEPALARLSDAGLRLGVITNVTADPSGDLERVGLKGRFDAIVASCIVGVEKPDARIFRAALDAVGVAPGEAVHVGDQLLADVQGAAGAGLKGVLLDRYNLQVGSYPFRIRSLLELQPLLRDGLA